MLTLTAPKASVSERLTLPNGGFHPFALAGNAAETALLEQVCAIKATKVVPPDLSRSCAWTTPILGEVSVGLEINGYLPAEI